MVATKTAAILTLSAAALLVGPDSVAGQDDKCISNTTDILEAEYADNLDPAVLREYILCPNTTFDIGTLKGLQSYVGGMPGMEIVSPNIHVLCGADGKRENNCVMQGGTQHVFAGSFVLGRSLANVLISGITFRGASLRIVQAAATTEGEEGIVFRDCLFQDNTDVVNIVEAQTFPGFNVDPLGMTVTLDSCTFDSNSVIPSNDGVGIVGLVWNLEHNMKIVNCEFTNNRAVVAEDADFVTCVIGNLIGGVMEVKDCLFQNNTVNVGLIYEEQVGAPDSIGPGTTTLKENVAMGSTSFPTATTDEFCDGLATHITSDPFEVECTEFSSSFPPTPIPTTVPTSVPTTETAMPTTATKSPTGIPTSAPVIMTTDMPTMAPVDDMPPADARSGAFAMGGGLTIGKVALLFLTMGTAATAMGGWC